MRNAVIFVLLSALMPVAFSRLHDFIFVPLNVNWSEAQSYCREHYTDLATVYDKEDNDNLLKVVANASAWIGLHRTSSESPLIWSDQSGSTFADWGPDQPNNFGGVQWCVNILQNRWNDQECFLKCAFVCHLEKKKRQIVRLEVKSGQDPNDPEVKKEILAKIEQILKEKGVSGEAKLSCRTQSDGNVFQTKDRKSCQTCL